MCKTKYNFTGDELYAKTERARERTHSHAEEWQKENKDIET